MGPLRFPTCSPPYSRPPSFTHSLPPSITPSLPSSLTHSATLLPSLCLAPAHRLPSCPAAGPLAQPPLRATAFSNKFPPHRSPPLPHPLSFRSLHAFTHYIAPTLQSDLTHALTLTCTSVAELSCSRAISGGAKLGVRAVPRRMQTLRDRPLSVLAAPSRTPAAQHITTQHGTGQ